MNYKEMAKSWLLHQQEGKPTMTEWQRADFRQYCKDNPKAKFRLEPLENKRTLLQNAFYWVYLEVIARETGNDSEDLHEYFKEKLLPRKIVKITGKKGSYDFARLSSTTKLNKVNFGEYLEKICKLTGVPIPNPEDAGYYK